MRRLRTPSSVALALALFGACRDVTVVLPEPESRLFLPVRVEDLRAEHYGIWPFGVHGGGHPEGHGGFDFELDREAVVVAAADGIVDRVAENGAFPGQWDVELRHDATSLRTSYGHLRDVPKAIVRGAAVRKGDPLGRPAWRADEGFAMIHFAVTDPRSDAPFGEVCPLTALGRRDAAALEAYWAALPADRKSAFEPELCNERVLVSRTGEELVGSWFRVRRPREGDAPRILTLTEFTRADGRRVFYATEGDGRMSTGTWAAPSVSGLELSPDGGEARRVRMRLNDGVLVLGSGAAATSYDRRFRSVTEAEGE